MKKLRLLLFSDCERNCSGCCNLDYDLAALPMCKDFTGYDEILLTGGEPMLRPELVLEVISAIRKVTPTFLSMYTAEVGNIPATLDILKRLDGICVTLHTQRDVLAWIKFYNSLSMFDRRGKSLRLNIFAGVEVKSYHVRGWFVKRDIEWIKNCPLSDGEVFMRLGSIVGVGSEASNELATRRVR